MAKVMIIDIICKTIFDCTVPWDLKDKFRRSPFVDVDVSKYLPSGNRSRDAGD